MKFLAAKESHTIKSKPAQTPSLFSLFLSGLRSALVQVLWRTPSWPIFANPLWPISMESRDPRFPNKDIVCVCLPPFSFLKVSFCLHTHYTHEHTHSYLRDWRSDTAACVGTSALCGKDTSTDVGVCLAEDEGRKCWHGCLHECVCVRAHVCHFKPNTSTVAL